MARIVKVGENGGANSSMEADRGYCCKTPLFQPTLLKSDISVGLRGLTAADQRGEPTVLRR